MNGTPRRLFLAAIAAGMIGLAVPALAQSPEQVAADALKAAPVWDGHNDVPIALRQRLHNMLGDFDFRDTSQMANAAGRVMHTDLARLRKGRVGAQFWSVFVPASLPEPQAVQATIEQIDLTKRLIARYPADLRLALTAADVERAMKAGRVASLMGMEGGHSIGGSLGVLRQMHALGVRYMTLTHSRNTAWADSATDRPAHGGLTDFGRDVVREMQRIGMLVDLSHVSEATMMDALDVARAPVMFSHSGAKGVTGHPRNVPDAVLDRLKANGGIVMAVTLPDYVSEDVRHWVAKWKGEQARLVSLHPGDPNAVTAGMAEWETVNPAPRARASQVADHVDYIARRTGVDHVGIGGDFDGMSSVVQGMEDVSTYPALFTELARRGYSRADLEKIASRNMLRVLRAAESYAASRRKEAPIEAPTAF